MIAHNLDDLAAELRAEIRQALQETGESIVKAVNASNEIKGSAVQAATRARMVSDTHLQITNDHHAAGYLEFGTRPHAIFARNAPVMVFEGNRGTVYAKRVNHPGNRAYRFIGEAVDAAVEEFTERITR